MGNEFSWPCTDRKSQERKLRESKYDPTFFEYSLSQESGTATPNLLAVENVLNQQGTYHKKPPTANSLSTTKSSSEKERKEFPETSEDPDNNEDFLSLLLTSRSIQPFENFIRDLKSIYEGKLVPITICPHPFKDESIVVLQSRERYNNFRMTKLTKFSISRLKRVFKLTANMPQEITAFISVKNQEGLSYIGCYVTEQSEGSVTFQFVYLQQEQQMTAEKPIFEYEALEDESISYVEEKLASRAKKNFIFRGTITIPNFNGSEFQEGANLQMMIFEKAFASYSYQAIEIPKKDFASEALMAKVSRSINESCETKGLDFSGITINSESGSIIVILAI